MLIGGRVFIRRLILEKILGGPIENSLAPRVSVVAPNGVFFRIAPHVAHKYMSMGAKIVEDDRLSEENYANWFEEQRHAAEVTS